MTTEDILSPDQGEHTETNADHAEVQAEPKEESKTNDELTTYLRQIGFENRYTDQEELLVQLAKKAAHGDQHIQTLLGEKKEIEQTKSQLEEELEKRMSGEEILNQLRDQQTETSKPAESEATPSENGVDVDKVFEQKITQWQAEQQAKVNRQSATQKLIEHYGDAEKATAAIEARAAQLGVGKQFLVDTANQSATAFIELMGITSQQGNGQSPVPAGSKPSVRTEKVVGDHEPGSPEWTKQMLQDKKNLHDPNFYRQQAEYYKKQLK